jgi:hypothetical protein
VHFVNFYCISISQCCAPIRTVLRSIHGGIFQWHIPSDCTMALGSTQLLVKMSTRNISWVWRRPVLVADDLATFMCWKSWKSGSLNLLEPSATPGLLRDCFTFYFLYHNARLNYVNYSSTLSLTSAPKVCVWTMPRPGSFTLGKDPAPFVLAAWWAPVPLWTGEEILAPTVIRTSDYPARS